MKKLIALTLVLAFFALAVQNAAAQVVYNWTWTGGAGDWSWTNGGNWTWTGGPPNPPQSYPRNANTNNQNEPQNVVNIDADAAAGTIAGIPSASSWNTFQGIINLNSGKMGLVANLYTGGVNQHTATPVGYNVGDGVGVPNSAVLDLAGQRWTPCRHPVTDNAYVIQVESDGLLTSAGNGKIQGGNRDDRKAFFYIRGGTFSIYHLALEEHDNDSGTQLDEFHLTGGVWEIELFTKHAGDTLFLGGGTIRSRTGGAITVNAASLADRIKLTGIDSLGNAQDTIFDTSNGNITWQNILSDEGGIYDGGLNVNSADGTGTFRMTANNTYVGDTTVSSGTLAFTGGTGVIYSGVAPAPGKGVVVQTGGILLLDSWNSVGTYFGSLPAAADALYVDGGVLQTSNTATSTTIRAFEVGTSGAFLESTGGQNWVITSLTADAATITNTLYLSGDGDGDLQATLDPTTFTASLAKTGAGTWTVSGNNSYTGNTTVSAGTLVVGSATALGDVANSGTLTVDGTGTLDTNNFSLTFADLQGPSATGTITDTNATTLSVKSGSYAGDIGGALSLDKVSDGSPGDGTLTLTSPNTYTGATTITAGTLSLASDTATLGAAATDVANNGTLNFNNATQTFSRVVAGTGNVTKTGTGTVTLTGINTYNGGTTISGGTLIVEGDGTLGSAGGAVVNNTTLTFNNTNGQTIGNAISGSGLVNKTGTGSVTLSGVSSYTGDTTVTAGTLSVAGTLCNGLNAATLDVQDGGTLKFAGAGTLGLQDGSTLTLNLHQNATFAGKAGGLGLTNLNLLLQGTHTNYNNAFIESITTSQLNSLVVAQGTPFGITINRAGIFTTGDLTITAGADLNPLDLSVTLTGDYANVPTSATFDVLTTGTGIASGGVDWSSFTLSDGKIGLGSVDTTGATMPTDLILNFYYENDELYGKFTEANVRAYGSGGNAEAMSAILSDPNPTGDTKTAQDTINAATTDKERDQITQQFTPSMALANVAENVQTSSQVLQVVAQNIAVTWRGRHARNDFIRAQNGSGVRNRSNGWLQGFGYVGEQAVKDGFAAYKNNGWGLAAGMDYSLGRRAIAGLAYGYSQTKLNSQSFNLNTETPAMVNTTGNTLLGYFALRTTSTTFVTLKAGNTWFQIDGIRRPFASDPAKIYTYATDASTWFVQAGIAIQWLEGVNFSLTPKAKLAYYGYSQDAYLENRPGLAPSSVGKFDNGYTQADMLLDWQMVATDELTLTATTGYRGLIGADGAVMTSGADGLSYNVNGVSAAEHQLVLDTGALFEISRNALLTTEYNFRVGEGSYLHGGTGSLVVTF